jgi:hypothetical protein
MSKVIEKSDELHKLIHDFTELRSERESNEEYYGENGIKLLREIIKVQNAINLEFVELWKEINKE